MCSAAQVAPLQPKNLLALVNCITYTAVMTPKNIVQFRLDGFPVDALDQKRMRRLRLLSERTGAPIPQLIRSALDLAVAAWIAEAELPNKILEFPAEIA
jgi:hypothetical protein